MIARVIDGILLAVALVGLWFTWETARERNQLEQVHARLRTITSDLPIGDPGRVHVRAVETGEPLHFAWRIYIPPNYPLAISNGKSRSSTLGRSQPEDFLGRMRFRENAKGYTEVYTNLGSSGSLKMAFDVDLTTFLRGRWGEIQVEQLGARGTAVLEPNRPTFLLRLTLPMSLQAEARKVLSEFDQKDAMPILYDFSLGPPGSGP